jgi:hypothetical protein
LINAYRLTEGVLHRYISAARSVREVPRIFPDTLFRRGQVGPTIDDLARILERNPVTRKALANAPITSREYVIFTVAMLQAGLGAWVVERHGWRGLDSGMVRENIVFYQRHKPYLDSLRAEITGREPREP